MKIALFGNGKMAKAIENEATINNHSIIATSGRFTSLKDEVALEADVLIDFSHADAVFGHLEQAVRLKKPLVIGTTGWELQQLAARELVEREEGSVLCGANFSIGIYLFKELIKCARGLFLQQKQYHLEGLEMHHRHKKDAPSGTARELAALFDDQLSFTSLRIGHACGTHTLIADSAADTITLTHNAKSREGFAIGALTAAQWLCDKTGWYTFDDLVQSLYSSHHSL